MSDLGNKEIFAKNLKYYMMINNKDRNDVSRDLDIPYTTVTSWYNAEFYPRIDKIELLSRYFGIEKSDLIENKKDENSKQKDDILNQLDLTGFTNEEIELIKKYIDFIKSQRKEQ